MGLERLGVCPLNKHAIEMVEDADDSILEPQSMDFPSTSSSPAGCNVSPSSFGQSDFNSS